jgi:hypothetical protein
LMKAFILRAVVYVWHAVVCTGVLALILGISWTACYALSVHKRRHAQRLLKELAALQTRVAGAHPAQQITKELGGEEHCTGDFCSYDFDERFAFSGSRLLRLLHRTEWDHFGLRPWEVEAHIATKNGVLKDMNVMIAIGRGRGWLYNEGLLSGNMWALLMASVHSNSESFESRRQAVQEYQRQSGVKTGHQIEPGSNGVMVMKPNLTTPGGGEALEVYLSPTATTESRAIAFDIELRCATAMSPCTELCQLAPKAWHTYSEYQESNGWWAEDPNCSRAGQH